MKQISYRQVASGIRDPFQWRSVMWRRILEILRKYLALLVLVDIGLALLVGDTAPHTMKALKPWVPIPLFFMLYPMMINFRIESAAKALRNPRVVLAALTINFVISPPLAFVFARVFLRGCDPYLIAGFLLKVMMTGSGMVAAWTGFAKGRVEAALTILVAGMIIIIPAVPFWMTMLARAYVPVHPWLMAKQIILIVALPLVAGVLTRRVILLRYGLDKYRSVQPMLPALSSLGMYAIVFIAVGMEARDIISQPHNVLLLLPSIAILYSSFFTLAMIYAKLAKLDYEDAIAIGYAVTAKNHTVTLALAITTLGGMSTLAPAFAPIVQILLMILILRITPWLRQRVFPRSLPDAPAAEGAA